jgi:hypothetical protein
MKSAPSRNWLYYFPKNQWECQESNDARFKLLKTSFCLRKTYPKFDITFPKEETADSSPFESLRIPRILLESLRVSWSLSESLKILLEINEITLENYFESYLSLVATFIFLNCRNSLDYNLMRRINYILKKSVFFFKLILNVHRYFRN